MASALRRAARIGIRVILGLLLCGATLAGIGAAGVAQTMDTSLSGTAVSAPPEGWPAAAVAPPGRIAVAVVLGATGSVVTDALAPIEVFARSSAFFVYTVSVHRQPVPLSGGLHVLPDHALADVDAGTAPRPGVVVVPAVIDPAGPAEAPLRAWITRQANRGARILGVCAGSVLLAETGLLDGLQATSFWQRISGLQRAHPAVRWQRGVRYVEDGPVTTTAGVTSGVVGALRLVEKLAGTQEAERIGTDIAYPGWSLDGSTAIAVNRIEVADLPYALNAAFPWWRPTVGIGLNPGVGEIDLAAAFEVYSGTSSAAATVAIAAGRTVVTRHGVVLVAEPADAATPAVERFVVPGVRAAAEVVPMLAAWAAHRRLRMELPHQRRADGEFSFDPVLRDLAAHADRATARTTAKYTEYPANQLRLTGPAWPARPTILLAISVAVAIGVGLLPTIGAGLLSRRRRRNAVVGRVPTPTEPSVSSSSA